MPIPNEQLRRWVINHQHNLVVSRYADVPESQPLVDFFAKFLYPSVKNRKAYEERNEFIRTIVGFYRRGKLRKALGPAVVFYAPMIWLAERMRELPEYLQRTVDLYDRTNELDARVVAWLAERINSQEQLTPEIYDRAMRETSSVEERRAQVEEVVGIGGYAVTLVERGGIVDLILSHVPHIPFFANNIHVRGLNESITMVQAGFRAFKSRKGMLHQFKEMCRQRELESVEKIFNPETQPAAAESGSGFRVPGSGEKTKD